MIYGRFGDPVTIVRLAVIDDVERFDYRKSDKRDVAAIESRSYVIVKQNDNGQERLYHLAYLKADGGFREIDEAIRATESSR